MPERHPPRARPTTRRAATTPAAATLEETRVARVDPQTGAELELAPAALEVGDATVVGRPLGAAERPPTRTVEILPPVDARATGEITACWNRGSDAALARLARGIVDRLRGARPRTRLLFLALLGSLAAIAVWPGRAVVSGGDEVDRSPPAVLPPPTDRRPLALASPAHPESTIERDGGVPAATVRSTPASLPDPGALRAAVDALVDGQLVEARRRYAALAARHPENEELALAVAILSRRAGAER